MSGLADALRAALDIAEAAHACVLEDRGNLDDGERAEADANERTMAEARAALAAHDAAVSAGGWYQGGDRTCSPSATTCRFVRDDGGIVAYMDGGTRAEAEARGARIVACVNACAGIADPGAMVAAFLDLSSYVGGHDERPGHPCRVASDILAPLRGAA